MKRKIEQKIKHRKNRRNFFIKAASYGMVLALTGSMIPVQNLYAEEAEEKTEKEDGKEAGTDAEEETVWEVVEINTAEDFLSFAANCTVDAWSADKRVILNADIDLSDTGFGAVPVFTGIFDGQGHTISGFRYSGDGYVAGLFRYIEKDGIVENLTLKGEVIASDEKECIGGLCGVNYGTIQKCSFQGTVSGKTTVGGLVGVNEGMGTVRNCFAGGRVTGYYSTGGIAGKNHGALSYCVNRSCINNDSEWVEEDDEMGMGIFLSISITESEAEIFSGVDTGGIAGYSDGVIIGCSNYGRVGYEHTGYNIGGIAGRQSGVVTSCTNIGTVYGRKDVGGIVGQMEPYIEVDEAMSLRNAVNRLHDLIEKTINDMEAGKNVIKGDIDSLASYSDGAVDAGDALVGQIGDFVDNNLDQVQAVTDRLGHVTDMLPAVFDDFYAAEDSFSKANQEFGKIADELKEMGNIGGEYVETDYARLTLLSTVGGNILSLQHYPQAGDTVHIMVEPNADYGLESIRAVDADGNGIGVQMENDRDYSFVMPEPNVRVEAYFGYQGETGDDGGGEDDGDAPGNGTPDGSIPGAGNSQPDISAPEPGGGMPETDGKRPDDSVPGSGNPDAGNAGSSGTNPDAGNAGSSGINPDGGTDGNGGVPENGGDGEDGSIPGSVSPDGGITGNGSGGADMGTPGNGSVSPDGTATGSGTGSGQSDAGAPEADGNVSTPDGADSQPDQGGTDTDGSIPDVNDAGMGEAKTALFSGRQEVYGSSAVYTMKLLMSAGDDIVSDRKNIILDTEVEDSGKENGEPQETGGEEGGSGNPAEAGAGEEGGNGNSAEAGAGEEGGNGNPAEAGAGEEGGNGNSAEAGAGTEGGSGNPVKDGAGNPAGTEEGTGTGTEAGSGDTGVKEPVIKLSSNLSGNASCTVDGGAAFLTVNPDGAYTVDGMPSVTAEGGNIPVTRSGDGEYSYRFDVSGGSVYQVDISFRKLDKSQAVDSAKGDIESAIQAQQAAAEKVNAIIREIQESSGATPGQLAELSQALEEMSGATSAVLGNLTVVSNILGQQAADKMEAVGDEIKAALEHMQGAVDSVKSATREAKGMVDYVNGQPDIRFSKLGAEFDNNRENLHDQLKGMSDSIKNLSGNASDYTDVVNDDLRAVNNQINVIFNLLADNVIHYGDISMEELYEDIDLEDTAGITTGKTNNCTNKGIVRGDINVGGVAGAMSIDEEDPEDSAAGSVDYRIGSRYFTKCIITDSVNEGYVTAKKDGAGGIVGYMRHGIVVDSEGYGSVESTEGDYVGGICGESYTMIKRCYALCSVSGGKNVGGIAGYADTLKDCYAMVDCEASIGRKGAIAGQTVNYDDALNGEEVKVSGNYYVGENLYGIDDISYVGVAEPISYGELLTVENLPSQFRHLKAIFRVDGMYLGVQEVKFGESLSVLDYPAIPERAGYYGTWPDYSGQVMTGNLLVTGEYKEDVTVVQSNGIQEAGGNGSYEKPYALVEQRFTEDTVLRAGIGAMEPPEKVHGREHVIYDIALENAGIKNTDTVAVRLLNPYGEAAVWGYRDGTWKELESKARGQYLQVDMTGAEQSFCIVEEPSGMWITVVCALGAAAVLILFVLLVKKGKKAYTGKRAKKAETPD
mgnify:FL=1